MQFPQHVFFVGNVCVGTMAIIRQNPNGWLTNGWLERSPVRNNEWPFFTPKAHLLIARLAQSKWVIRALIAHLDDSRWVISTGAFGVKKRSFIVPRPLYAHRPSPNRPLGFRRIIQKFREGVGGQQGFARGSPPTPSHQPLSKPLNYA